MDLRLTSLLDVVSQFHKLPRDIVEPSLLSFCTKTHRTNNIIGCIISKVPFLHAFSITTRSHASASASVSPVAIRLSNAQPGQVVECVFLAHVQPGNAFEEFKAEEFDWNTFLLRHLDVELVLKTMTLERRLDTKITLVHFLLEPMSIEVHVGVRIPERVADDASIVCRYVTLCSQMQQVLGLPFELRVAPGFKAPQTVHFCHFRHDVDFKLTPHVFANGVVALATTTRHDILFFHSNSTILRQHYFSKITGGKTALWCFITANHVVCFQSSTRTMFAVAANGAIRWLKPTDLRILQVCCIPSADICVCAASSSAFLDNVCTMYAINVHTGCLIATHAVAAKDWGCLNRFAVDDTRKTVYALFSCGILSMRWNSACRTFSEHFFDFATWSTFTESIRHIRDRGSIQDMIVMPATSSYPACLVLLEFGFSRALLVSIPTFTFFGSIDMHFNGQNSKLCADPSGRSFLQFAARNVFVYPWPPMSPMLPMPSCVDD